MDYKPKEKETPGYKRVHFFKYFLTEDDWNARHNYHLQKMRLHTSVMHGIGIQAGTLTLRVLQTTPASLKLEITPGIGTDAQGREIFVSANDSVTVEPEKFQLPATIYIKVVYQEIATDRCRMPDGRIENRYFRESYRFIVSDQDTISRYSGSVILVSHDRRFLDNVVTRLLVPKNYEMPDGKWEECVGGYEDWLRTHTSDTASATKAKPANPAASKRPRTTAHPLG